MYTEITKCGPKQDTSVHILPPWGQVLSNRCCSPPQRPSGKAEVHEVQGCTEIRRDHFWCRFEVSLVLVHTAGEIHFQNRAGFCFLLGVCSYQALLSGISTFLFGVSHTQELGDCRVWGSGGGSPRCGAPRGAKPLRSRSWG